MSEPVMVEGFDVAIDPLRVERSLGVRDGSRGRLSVLVEEEIGRARGLLRPRGVTVIAPGSALGGLNPFRDLSRMAFCVCTIGPGLERAATELAGSGELYRSVVLDAVGSAATEAVAGHIEERIRREAADGGLTASHRASPGYPGWDLREQESLFRLVPGERIGVRLSETCMMIPRMSISFALHLAVQPARLPGESTCPACERKDCSYRTAEPIGRRDGG
jgi:hypothetical protein